MSEKKKKPAKKIKVYELDFGDKNLISDNTDDLLAWIETDLIDLQKKGDELQYKITVKFMTEKQYRSTPEWD